MKRTANGTAPTFWLAVAACAFPVGIDRRICDGR